MARIAKELDLVGTRIGRLKVIERADDRITVRSDGYNRTIRYWNCKCDCGNYCEVRQDAILGKTSNSCGCITREVAKENVKKAQRVKRKPENLVGNIYGRLTVLSQDEYSYTPKGRPLARWLCQCSCGNTISHLGDSLRQGKAVSCGCVNVNFVDTGFNSPQEVFEHKAKLVHGEKYLYDKTSYIHSLKKVCVTCPEHGDFYLTPANHLQGQGCKICTYEVFSEKQHYSYLKRCELDSEFSNRLGCVYVIKLTNSLESFIKVGVSCSREKRFNAYTSAGFTLEVINIAEMTNQNSALLENKILSTIKEAGYKYNPITEFVGYTECAKVTGEAHILSIIKEFCIERQLNLTG